MAENLSHSKIKKRKVLVSDSGDDEVLKKHKSVDSKERTEGEAESYQQISGKSATGSKQQTEKKRNGKYEQPVENGMDDSDSAGTDVELTTDDESPDTSRRPKKKMKICVANERRSRNNIQVESSSDSQEDEGHSSPKTSPTSKKAFRRRRTISRGRSPSIKSSDSDSYKTDSESDGESQKQEPSNSSTGIRSKKGGSKSQAVKEASSAKNKVEEGSSGSEDIAPLQRPKCYSSSGGSDQASEDNEQQVSLKRDRSGTTTESKQVIDKDTESSPDQCLDPTGPQNREEIEKSIKSDSSSDEGKVKTHPDTTEDSEDETSRNPDVVKSESTTGDSDSEPLIKAKADREIEPKKKKIKEEESSSDSGSDSSHEKKSAKGAEAFDSSSSKEDTKKQKRQKDKLPDQDKQIISLKKYLKIAGIRVHNYSDLWKDCRSNKARAQKLMSLLEQNGIKGRPTIEKCKKLKKKLETKREVEELDLANVMEYGEGRTRRSRQGTSASKELPDEVVQTSSDIRKRLRVFVDSDSSESD